MRPDQLGRQHRRLPRPVVIGWVRDETGSFTGSLLFLAAVVAATAGVAALLGRRLRPMLAAEHPPAAPIRKVTP